ncbi:hypothetical protein NGA79_03735 [Lactococcus garvieae]|uniref:hypothetical protein n=1 Tax=Lactococcus TaxID=1357 RepID=UPI0005A8CC40|nr:MULTISPECIES: hypothetical protein [Lactococcus]MDG6191127.1 hypothetical protein [Lactococcus garvieae]NHI74338.1 hypothetical protein [Lactococcus garvieae]PCS00279.1 hypothetical protein RU85_GL000699 [Lactococcus garvieae]
MWIYVMSLFVFLFAMIQILSWKISLFFVSFSPLFVILSIKAFLELYSKNIENKKLSEEIVNIVIKYFVELSQNFFWLVVLILSIMPPVIFLIRMGISIVRKGNQVSLEISEPSQLDDGIVSYVMTYIVPLTSLSFSASLSEYISNILLFLIIMVLYVRMNLVYLNPVLIILGFNIFKATINGSERYILTRNSFPQFGSLSKRTSVAMLKLNNNFYFIRKIHE